MTTRLTIEPFGPAPLQASVRVPGSKSYTNRALLVAALGRGSSTLTEALFSDDTRYMGEALNRLGLVVRADEAAGTFDVVGCDGHLPDVSADLYVGTAGT